MYKLCVLEHCLEGKKWPYKSYLKKSLQMKPLFDQKLGYKIID